MIRILIADDHRLLRDGLRRLLEGEPDLRVCGEAADGADAVRQVRVLKPDLLLLDVAMPGVDGVEALQLLEDWPPGLRVLLLTGAIDQDRLLLAMQLGARGVVMKDAPSAVLVKAIRSVIAGEIWVGRERVSTLVDALRPRGHIPSASGPDPGLTPRELLIVAGIVAAYPNREIASQLDISEKTVKRHLTNIFDKVGVSSRVELAMFAVRHDLRLPAFPVR